MGEKISDWMAYNKVPILCFVAGFIVGGIIANLVK